MYTSLENVFPPECVKDLQSIKINVDLNNFDIYRLVVLNQHVLQIPYRIYIKPLTIDEIKKYNQPQQIIISCVFTRHHNGFIRHQMVNHIMQTHPILKEDDFVIPFIFLLLGEYVAEICEDLYPYIKANKSVIEQFIKNNKEFSYVTYQRSVSYWNEYYRLSRYKYLRDYPARKIFDLFPFVYTRKY